MSRLGDKVPFCHGFVNECIETGGVLDTLLARARANELVSTARRLTRLSQREDGHNGECANGTACFKLLALPRKPGVDGYWDSV